MGSDQIWNPMICARQPAFFLNFASSGKKCISYAASIARNDLSFVQIETFAKLLARFDYISLRENNYNKIEIPPKKIECCVDPTLLLSQEEWNTLASSPRFSEPYIFCYIFGDDKKIRKFAMKLGKLKRLKLVTVPYLSGFFNFADAFMDATKLFHVSPSDFLSLIKNADYIITDSFHATVFSIIFHKQFYVFERKGSSNMGSRIATLTELSHTQSHFITENNNITIQEISAIAPLDFVHMDDLQVAIEKSISFLKSSLFQ